MSSAAATWNCLGQHPTIAPCHPDTTTETAEQHVARTGHATSERGCAVEAGKRGGR